MKGIALILICVSIFVGLFSGQIDDAAKNSKVVKRSLTALIFALALCTGIIFYNVLK